MTRSYDFREGTRLKARSSVLSVLFLLAILGCLCVACAGRQNVDDSGRAFTSSSEVSTNVAEPEPATTRLSIAFDAEYLGEGSSCVPVSITGTTDEGNAYDETFFVSPVEGASEPIELLNGGYVVEVLGSPISADGVIYTYDGARAELELDADEGETAEESITLALSPVNPLRASNEQLQAAYDWALKDEEHADAADSLGTAMVNLREKAKQAALEKLADAYDAILDNAWSYVDAGYTGDVEYALYDLTGDGYPELLLMAHYGEGSGYWDIHPFVYDTQTGGVVEAKSEEGYIFSVMLRHTLYLDPDNHALIGADSDRMWNTTYSRSWIEGTVIKSEEIGTGNVMLGGDGYVDGLTSLTGWDGLVAISDRSLIDSMCGREPRVSQESNHFFECEWFYVDLPEAWVGNLTVESIGENEWQFAGGIPNDYFVSGGSANVKVYAGDGYPDGYTKTDWSDDLYGYSRTSDGTVYGIYVKGVVGGTVLDTTGIGGEFPTITIKNPA